jgi:hypothetical protein
MHKIHVDPGAGGIEEGPAADAADIHRDGFAGPQRGHGVMGGRTPRSAGKWLKVPAGETGSMAAGRVRTNRLEDVAIGAGEESRAGKHLRRLSRSEPKEASHGNASDPPQRA